MRLLSGTASSSPELGHLQPGPLEDVRLLLAQHGTAPAICPEPLTAPELAAHFGAAADQVPASLDSDPEARDLLGKDPSTELDRLTIPSPAQISRPASSQAMHRVVLHCHIRDLSPEKIPKPGKKMPSVVKMVDVPLLLCPPAPPVVAKAPPAGQVSDRLPRDLIVMLAALLQQTPQLAAAADSSHSSNLPLYADSPCCFPAQHICCCCKIVGCQTMPSCLSS